MNKLGIDIGYSTFKYVYLDNEDNLIESNYIFHKGNIIKYYSELIKKIKVINKETNIIIGITGSLSSYIDKATEIPRIAGRCSVFSKTDMIHHMQDGVKVENILQGLCYALVRNYKIN